MRMQALPFGFWLDKFSRFWRHLICLAANPIHRQRRQRDLATRAN